jgi:hypothetical protein
LQILGGDNESVEDKRHSLALSDVECLAYSYRSIARIDNLNGLNSLTKLQLDNNKITKIENLSHLVNLSWLDLSFNEITTIEGLNTLTKLTDLSLFNNKIEVIENLDELTQLHVLSVGNNLLTKLDDKEKNIMYLRRFSNLRLLNLAGNPFCKEHNYRPYVLSHVKNLTYLDYRRVKSEHVQQAMEQYQDEMNDLQETEENSEKKRLLEIKKKEHEAEMSAANLEGIETLLQDMTDEDPEWTKLSSITGNLLEGWDAVKEKFTILTDPFIINIKERHQKKKEEYEEWHEVVKVYLSERDQEAKDLILDYEKLKKNTTRRLQADPSDTGILDHPKIRLVELKDQLLEIEMDTVEALQELIAEFDRNYTEIAEGNKALYNQYFTAIRDGQSNFYNSLNMAALALFEKFQESNDQESQPEEARILLQDKDQLIGALQASWDSHTLKVDTLEDKLTSREMKGANELAHTNAMWGAKRNRDRISEIINYIERNMYELEELAGEEEYDN